MQSFAMSLTSLTSTRTEQVQNKQPAALCVPTGKVQIPGVGTATQVIFIYFFISILHKALITF